MNKYMTMHPITRCEVYRFVDLLEPSTLVGLEGDQRATFFSGRHGSLAGDKMSSS